MIVGRMRPVIDSGTIPIGRLNWQKSRLSNDTEPLPWFVSPIQAISNNHAFYEGTYRYSGVEAEGQHQTILWRNE
jgi:hypothetical protein